MSLSIRSQLSRSLIIALCVIMGGLLLVVNWGVSQLSHAYISSRLKHDAESVISALQQNPESKEWFVASKAASSVYQRALSGHYYLVTGEGIEIRSRSLWDYPLELDRIRQGRTISFSMPGVNDQNWQVLQQGFIKDGQHFNVAVIEDSSPLEALRWRYSVWALLVVIIGAVALFILQQWIIKKNFRYLDSVRRQIQSLRYQDQPHELEQVPAELAPLAEDIDQLLLQLKQRVSRSRNALGNLAHEIKRPLQRLQQLQEEPDHEFSDDVKQLLDDIRWLIQREMKRARIVGVTSPGRQSNLATDLPPVIAILQKLYPAIRLQTELNSVSVLPLDRDDMLELIGNLLDNGCKFGLSSVQLRVEILPGQVVIKVEDDGRGMPEQSIDKLKLRGERLDERHEGAGLGLSICSEIVEQYQGQLTLSNIAPHGFLVTVTIPV